MIEAGRHFPPGRRVRRRFGTMIPASIIMLTVSAWSVSSGAAELIQRQDWEKVTSAVSVLQIPALQRVFGSFESGEDMIIVIQYPGGDAGNEWAIELRDWLVAFGIRLDRIELQPGSGVPGAIAIEAEPRSNY